MKVKNDQPHLQPQPSNSEEWDKLASDVIEGLTMFSLKVKNDHRS